MIGGNTVGELYVNNGKSKNKIGEVIENKELIASLTGFLDFLSDNSKSSDFKADVRESTHVFICDYVKISDVSHNNKTMIIDGCNYIVTLIDDPMLLHNHLEIYLRKVD